MKHIFRQFEDEIEGACEYVRCAAKYAGGPNHEMSKMYLSMANDEISHARKLFDAANSKADENEGYRLIVDFMNEQLIETMAKVKAAE